MLFRVQIRIQPRTVAVLVLAVTALVCLGGLAGPAMAGSMSQDCYGPACEAQIGCGQPAQPQASSGSSVHLVALPAAVERGLLLTKTETRSIGPPPLRAAWHPFAPVAPRSPPAV
jgi:hypothetical protein